MSHQSRFLGTSIDICNANPNSRRKKKKEYIKLLLNPGLYNRLQKPVGIYTRESYVILQIYSLYTRTRTI